MNDKKWLDDLAEGCMRRLYETRTDWIACSWVLLHLEKSGKLSTDVQRRVRDMDDAQVRATLTRREPKTLTEHVTGFFKADHNRCIRAMKR